MYLETDFATTKNVNENTKWIEQKDTEEPLTFWKHLILTYRKKLPIRDYSTDPKIKI